MSFTINDFNDLLRLLEERPDFREQLRRYIIPDELLRLPALVAQIAEHLIALTARVDALAEAQERTETRVAELAQAQARTEVRLDRIEARLDALIDKVDQLDGDALESKYARQAGGYFRPIVRWVRVIDSMQLATLIDDAIDDQRLSAEEGDSLALADLVLSGRRRSDQAEVYIVVEVSAGIGVSDVRRAEVRAKILAKLGRPVIPIVAGRSITAESVEMARTSGVWQLLNGRPIPPDGP